MSVASLHPEELFDKAERGVLTASERTRFDEHLRGCSVCRLEQSLRADFADEHLDADAPPFSPELLAAALGAAKETHADEREPAREKRSSLHDITPGPTQISTSPSAMPRRPRWWGLAVAGLCTLVGLAGAERTHLVQTATAWLEPPHMVMQRVAIQKPAAPVSIAAAPAPPAFVAPQLATKQLASKPLAPREDASSLFDEVVTARRAHEYDRSIAACRRLQTRYPASREAQVSRGTLGRLLLDRGDAEGALESFAEYQRRGGGELEEAVMVGRATAYERLGREAEAKRAWLALLDAFPSTPYAEQARARSGATPH